MKEIKNVEYISSDEESCDESERHSQFEQVPRMIVDE